MISKEREDELNYYFGNETNDEESWEWRKDLSEDERSLVKSWDEGIDTAFQRLHEKIDNITNSEERGEIMDKNTAQVKIDYSESEAVFQEGKTLDFFEANREFAAENFYKNQEGLGSYKVGYTLQFDIEGTKGNLKGSYDVGKVSGQYDLLSHIKQNLQTDQELIFVNKDKISPEQYDRQLRSIKDINEKVIPYLEYLEERVMESEENITGRVTARETTEKSYLNIPKLDKEQFTELLKELKENGAKFDAEQKRWHVPDEQNLQNCEEIIGKYANHKEFSVEQHYKGFAYVQGNNKPTIVYGTSKDDILGKINSWNQARMEDNRFKSCNIGELNTESNRYDNYHKYDVATGRDISNIPLHIPRMGKEEFQKAISELKHLGAKYNPVKKEWYVTADADMGKFSKYLPGQEENSVISAEEIKAAAEEARKLTKNIELKNTDLPNYSIKPTYEIVFEDGRESLFLDQRDMGNPEQITAGELLENIEEAIIDQIQPDTEKEYLFSVSQENQCSVYFADGRDPIVLQGEQLGIDFTSMIQEEVSAFVDDYVSSDQQYDVMPKTQVSYEVGDVIDCYKPQYTPFDSVNLDKISNPTQTLYVQDVEHVKGIIAEKHIVSEEEGIYSYTLDNEGHIYSDQIYEADQAEVLIRTQKDDLPPEHFDLVANHTFTSAQMEEVRFGFKDGLSLEQVKNYADPIYSAGQMDLCRYGQIQGVPMEDIKKIIIPKESASFDWKECRKQLDVNIKSRRTDMKKSFATKGYQVNNSMVKKIEKLNHMTKKTHTGKDICEAFKSQTYKDSNPEGQKIVNEIGNELKAQEIARNIQAQALCPQ